VCARPVPVDEASVQIVYVDSCQTPIAP
jgi:hypothetical protein